MDKQARIKAANELGKTLDKTFKTKGTFQIMGKKVGQLRPTFPTQLPSCDWGMLAAGGVPKGCVVEVFGPESSGKTAWACHVIGQVQKAGGMAAFVDAEHALDPTFASVLGVNMDELLVSQPDYGEQALDVVEALVKSNTVDIIVVDSVSALVPKAELDGEMGESHMGLQARLMSQAMRKLCGSARKHGVTIIFINQVREKIGVVFGDPEVTSGGKALKFYATIRLRVKRLPKSSGGLLLDIDKNNIGHKMEFKCVKNKVGPPFREAQIDLYYASGFDTVSDTLDHAVKIGVLTGGIKYAWPDKATKYTREEMEAQIEEVQKAITKHYTALAEPAEEEDNEEAETDES
jgi:recombination protein RecA